jgi:pyroglutamyl-peptidase
MTLHLSGPSAYRFGMSAPTTVLLTGFGPFPGVPVNATSVYVPQLAEAARQRFPEAAVIAEVLPTEWHEAPRRLEALLAAHEPALALHFGVSAEARGFVIETTARNLTCAKADACGALPPSLEVLAGAPESIATALPAGLIAARLTVQGWPAAVSVDAGNYLCNAVLYRSLHHAATRAPRPSAVFVHLPASLADHEPAAAGPKCPLSWAGALAGGVEIIAVCLEGVAADAASPA